MNDFSLNQTLVQDTIELGRLNNQVLLLMNNVLLPWFIIVPMTHHKEIFQLEENQQSMLYKNINILSRHLLQYYEVSKINIGAIGNIVSQLHIHVIGRSESDHAWPNVVWGNPQKIPYNDSQVNQVLNNLVSDDEIGGFIQNVKLSQSSSSAESNS